MKKKIINVLLSAAVITTMMFSVTACGSKADDAQNTAADAPVETQAAVDANAGDDTKTADETKTADVDEQNDDAADGAMSLEEWTESDECIEFLELMNEDMDGMFFFFEADGDVLTFVCQDDEQMGVLADIDGDDKEALDGVMGAIVDSIADLFESIRDGIIEETGNENLVLRMEYRDADGLVIYSHDF